MAQAVPVWASVEYVWAPRVGGPVWLHDEHHSGGPPGTLTHSHLELAAGSKGREGPPSPVPCPGPCGAVWAGAGLCSVPMIPWRLVSAWAGCARWARAMQTSRAALTQCAVQCRASAWPGAAGRGPVDAGAASNGRARRPPGRGQALCVLHTPSPPPPPRSDSRLCRSSLSTDRPSAEPSARSLREVGPGPPTAAGPQSPPLSSLCPEGPLHPLPASGPVWRTLNALLPDFHPVVSPHCLPVHASSQKREGRRHAHGLWDRTSRPRPCLAGASRQACQPLASVRPWLCLFLGQESSRSRALVLALPGGAQGPVSGLGGAP